METNTTYYYGFSVNAENFLLPSELQALIQYQQNNIITNDANEIVKFIASSMFSVNTCNNESHLCIAQTISNDFKVSDLEKYNKLISEQLDRLNMLVPRQCHIEWELPRLFSLEDVLMESH